MPSNVGPCVTKANQIAPPSSSNPMGQSKKKRHEITSEALQLHPFIWTLNLTSPSLENRRSDYFPPSRDTPINAREQVGTEKGGGIAPFT